MVKVNCAALPSGLVESELFGRLGSPRTIKIDVRLIAATHRDLAEDIPLLVWAFLEEFSSRMGKKITQVPRETMDALQRRPWPGRF